MHYRAAWALPLLMTVSLTTDILAADRSQKPADLPFTVRWTVQRARLTSMYFVDASTGWAVGKSGVILATSDGGMSWNQQPGGTDDLEAVYFVNAAIGWAVGDHHEVLSTSNGGKTWKRHFSEPGVRLNSVYFVSPSTGWAVGDEGLILATTDSFNSWREKRSDAATTLTHGGPRHLALHAVHFVNAASGWAVGEMGVILATSDGGKTWSRQASGTSEDLDSVYFVSPSIGRAAGDRVILATSDGGKSWSQKRNEIRSDFRSVHFVNATFGWAIGKDGMLVATKDGGKTWNSQEGAGQALSSVHFVSPAAGWAVGAVILATSDAGKTWKEQLSSTDHHLQSVYFVNSTTGWAVGDRGVILTTGDGGRNWNLQPGGAAYSLESVYFVNSTSGWAVGDRGVILATGDGGRNWNLQGGNLNLQGNDTDPLGDAYSVDLHSVYFVNTTTGWAVGEGDLHVPGRELSNGYYETEAIILSTSDGGKTWSQQKRDGKTLWSVDFVSPSTGWAVGSRGLILATTNGGKTWNEQLSGTNNELKSVYFVNSTTGWAAGGDVILATSDSGKTWIQTEIGGEELLSIHFPPNSTTGWAVGRSVILKGELTDSAAFVTDLVVLDQPFGVLLAWKARYDHPERVYCDKLEYRAGDRAEWAPIKLGNHPLVTRDGKFSFRWNPGDYGIGEGSKIQYRITLRDKMGLAYEQQMPGLYGYKPWWQRQSTSTRAAMVVIALSLVYFLTCFVLLLFHPLSLLWLNDHLDLKTLLSLAPSSALAPVLSAVFATTGLHYFAKHHLTRRAWIAKYSSGARGFKDLQPPVREAFVAEPECLDAWVERRRDSARSGFARIKSVEQRQVYIDLPVRVGKPEEGQRLSEPKPEDFRPLLALPCAVLPIIGEGGAGKSTLACQLARWAIAEEPAQRLASQRMIPIFLEQETLDLVAAVTGQLTAMVGPHEVDPDLVRELLRNKRLLVIVDALSERSLDTQKHVQSIHQVAAINAIVVTTRQPPDFGVTPVTQLWPEPVTVGKLVYFLTEYLRRVGAEDLFPGREVLQLADRLLALVEAGGKRPAITPLLIRLFIDQALALRKSRQPIDRLPASVPEVVLDYLRRTNPQDPQTPNYVRSNLIVEAARLLGWCSLGDVHLSHPPPPNGLVPGDFYRDTAGKKLADHGFTATSELVIDRLIANGVLEEITPGGIRVLRFSLDPLAEYLAALHLIDILRANASGWRKWLAYIETIEGYPPRIRGFLLALEDSITAYRKELAIPVTELPWGDRLLRPLDPPADAASAES
jgi:photosystem II stability/assembly factor-like uncharacterized protein